MPHLEIQPPEDWKGKSKRGPFGDVIAELDNTIGRLFRVLELTGIDKETLVIFTSDNGPAHIYQKPAFPGGQVKPLSGGKGSILEGGFRFPGIFRWPGTIPGGEVSDEVTSTVDLLTTFVSLCGGEFPDREVDGVDLSPLLRGQKFNRPAKAPFLYFHRGKLSAIRSGKWKFHTAGKLFDLDIDPGEKEDLAGRFPELSAELAQLAETKGKDIEGNSRPLFGK